MENTFEKNNYIYSIKKYLATYFKTEAKTIDQMLKNELATSFLLIWPIFEQEFFGGFCKINIIEKFSKDYESFFDNEEIFQHFYLRYQDKNNYRHLIHEQKYDLFEEILKKPLNEITNDEKLLFVTYVIYRYRNNIFHANEGIESWAKYGKQIAYCIEFMTSILEKSNVQDTN